MDKKAKKKQNKRERDSIKGHKAEAKPTAGEEKVGDNALLIWNLDRKCHDNKLYSYKLKMP